MHSPRIPQRPRYAARLRLAAAVAGVFVSARAGATDLDTIGVTQLNAFDPTIDGAGVTVGQAEGDISGVNTFEVEPSYVDQPASLFTYIDDFGNVSTTYNPSYESGHGNEVAVYFYGLNGYGVSTGVAHVDNYSAQFFTTVTIPDLIPIPDAVVNQSFILNEPNNDPLTAADQETADTLYDNYAAEYGTIFVSAAGNGGMYPNVSAPATMYNGIGVGDAYGSESIGPTIDNGRSKPDITAPGNYTSFSTPYVSGVVTDLIQAGRRGDGGSTPLLESEAVDERTIKALLLNGASKTGVTSFNRTPTAPLDPTNGAGMVNAFNSYQELVAGQHSASSVVNTAGVGGDHSPLLTGSPLNSLSGWDFSTLTTSPTNDQYANYLFTPATGFSYTFTATLVWNRQFNNNPSVPLGVNNLDLYFYNVTTDTLVDSSVSTVDNVQDVYDLNLPGGDEYDLEVLKNGGTPGVTSGVISNSETYALAFNFAAPTTQGVWDAAAGSWAQGGYWALGDAPQNSGDTAMFGAVNGAACTVTLDAGQTVGVLIFKSTNAYTLAPGTGGVLYMDSPTGSASISDEGGTHTISAPVVVLSNTTVTVTNATDTLLISGAIGGAGSITELGAGTLKLTGSNNYSGGTTFGSGAIAITNDAAINYGNGGLTFSGGSLEFSKYTSTLAFANVANLSLGATAGTATLNGLISGSYGLQSVGPGTLVLSANNTYAGPTTLAGGVLAINSDARINHGAGGILFTGGTLQLDNYTSTLSFAGVLSLSLGAANGSASILSGNVTGTAGLNFTGPGTLILSGTNTYTGGTVLSGGRLELGNSSSIGNAALTINSGTLDLNGSSETFTSLAGTGGAIDNVSAGGNVTLTIASTNVTTYSGVIKNTTGTLSLVKLGSGYLNLAGVDTYTGGTTLDAGTIGIGTDASINYGNGGLNFSGGTLEFNNYTSTLSFANTASLDLGASVGKTATLAGNITGSTDLTFAGPGTLVLTGTNTYTGGTTLNGGILEIGSDSEINDAANGINFNGGILQFRNYTSTLSFANVPNVTLGAAAGSASTLTGSITGSSGLTFTGPGTLILSGANLYSGPTNITAGSLAIGSDAEISYGAGLAFSGGALQFDNYTSTLTFTNTANLSLGAAAGSGSVLSTNITGTTPFSFVGPGTLLLAGSNTYTGGTNVSGGRLRMGDASAIGPGVMNITGGTLDLNGFNLTVNALTGSGGTLTNVSGNTKMTLTVGASNGSGTYSGKISNTAGTISLVKIGSGTQVLSGSSNNSYGGTTTLDAGALAIASDGQLGKGAVIFAGGTLQFMNYSSTLSFANTANLSLGASPGGAATLSGNITGTQGLTFNGPGILVLSGNDTYTGPTTINAGTLEVGNSPSIGSGPLILNNGGGIELNGFSESFASLNGSDGVIDYVSATANDLTLTIGSGNVNATYGGTIQNVYGPIVLSMTGSAVQTLTGSNSYTGGTILNSGTLAINSDQAIGFAVGGIDFNGGTLQFDNCASTLALSGTNVSLGAAAGAGSTLVGSITDSGTPTNLTYVGPGTLILAGSNSYSGATNVNAGTMQITTPGSIPATTTLTIGSATSTGAVQLATSGGAFTLSGLTINVGSSLDLANNSLTINYGSSDPIAAIVSYLSAGYAAGWASGQIVSSAVASLNASQKALLYDIGYADGADGLTSLPSGEIEIVPTIAGDAKLQGNVVFGDFQLLAQYFGQSGTWDEGNFSYGPTIDFGDFQMLAQDFGSTSGGLTPQEITALQNFAAQFGDALTPNPDGVGFSLVSVPEPASVSLLAGGVGLLARRRRRSPNR